MIKQYCGIENPFRLGGPVYDYAALESLAEFKKLAEPDEVRVIAVVDTNSKAHGIVFGMEFLRAIAAEVIGPQMCVRRVFALDFATDHLEHLLAATTVVKGYHEWPEGGS